MTVFGGSLSFYQPIVQLMDEFGMERCLDGVPVFLMEREERVRARPLDEQVVHVVNDLAVDVPFRPNRMDVLRWDLDVTVAGESEHGNTHIFEPLPDVIG